MESLQVTVLFKAIFCYHQWWLISVCQQTKRGAEQSRPMAKWAVSLYQSEVVLKFSVVRNRKIKRWGLRWVYWTVGCGNKLHNSECQSSDEPSPLYLHQPWSTVLRPKKVIWISALLCSSASNFEVTLCTFTVWTGCFKQSMKCLFIGTSGLSKWRG